MKAYNEGDAEGCAKTYAEDAVFMTPKLDIIKGRAGIKQFFVEDWAAANGAAVEIEEEVKEVIYFGDWAVMRGLGEINVSEADSIRSTFNFK